MLTRIKTALPLLAALAAWSCEIDTRLSAKGGNPPVFVMSGSGTLTSIRVGGHEKQREAEGEDSSLYWVINSNKDQGRIVGRMGSVTYGKIPEGYSQRYPERGEAPPLEEGQHYHIQVITMDANGDSGYFMIVNGKTIFARYESDLPDESKAPK